MFVLLPHADFALNRRATASLSGLRMSGKPRRVLAELPFTEARAMARSMGMSSREEWEEYSCPGAYRLPNDPDMVWAADWQGCSNEKYMKVVRIDVRANKWDLFNLETFEIVELLQLCGDDPPYEVFGDDRRFAYLTLNGKSVYCNKLLCAGC